jgi:Zn-dependent oligopeptidase
MNFSNPIHDIDSTFKGLDGILYETEDEINQIKALSESQCTFYNVFKRWHDLWANLENLIEPFIFLQEVSPDEKVRDAARDLEELYRKWCVDQTTQKEVYKRFEWALRNGHRELSVLDCRYSDRVMREFRHSGLQLPEKQLEIYRTLCKELSELEIQYSKNIADGETQLEFKKEALEGVPQNDLERMENGHGFTVTSQYPDVFAVLENCSVPETRKSIYEMHTGKCQNNIPVLERMIQLRYETSQMLGYASYTDMQAEDLILKSKDEIMEFLESVRVKIAEPLARDQKMHGGDRMEDFYYNKTQYMKQQQALDYVAISKHFPTDHVIQKTFEIFQNFFHVRLVEAPLPLNYHYGVDDVRYFLFLDENTGKLLGDVILDLFPRAGKFSHAAEFRLRSRPHVTCALVTNFDRKFLTFEQVETLFHEFGHVVHEILGGGKEYVTFSGTEVETDFVETPSQILENWCYEPMVLAYVSDPPLDNDTMEKLRSTRYIFESMYRNRQLALSLTDLRLYHQPSPPDQDYLRTAWVNVANEMLAACPAKATQMGCWGHMVGYASKYFSYTVSNIISHDMYSRFRDDPLNPELGAEYRAKVLDRGGEVDAKVMIRDFLGRDLNVDNYIQLLQ